MGVRSSYKTGVLAVIYVTSTQMLAIFSPEELSMALQGQLSAPRRHLEHGMFSGVWAEFS